MATRYRFPTTNQDDYKGTISFTALEEVGATQGTLDTLLAQSSTVNATPDAQRAVERGDAAASTDIVSPAVSDQLAFQGRDTTVATVFGSNRFTNPPGGREKVTLYLPSQLTFSDGVEYTNVSLNASGAAAEAALRSGASGAGIVGAMISGALPDIDSVLDAIRGSLSTETAALAALRTVGRLSETARSVVEVGTQVALNPNKRSVLRGVEMRNFSFTFTLIPTTREESDTIGRIIQWFREQMYPEDIVVGGVSVGYKFPNKFQISMNYNGNAVAHGILPCYLRNVSTTYNPNNMAMHRDGSFPEVVLNLQFIEERTLRKEDIRGGF